MENTYLTLEKIYIGSTDAKNELLYGDSGEIENYKDNFVIPPSLGIDAFRKKQRYFITGLKGIGKTALLRYIDISMSDEDTISNFILFKTDIDDNIKLRISQLSRIKLCGDNSDEYGGKDDDFEIAWRWFIYKQILLTTNKYENFFIQDISFKKFKAIIDSVDSKSNPSWKVFPTIKRGMININISSVLAIELNLDFMSRKKEVRFGELVGQLDETFKELKINKGRLNLFFDELELNYNSSKQYKKDARLIRDLIVSIEKINAVAKKNRLDICIYAAIRSEVLHVVEALGKEINKPIADFGIEILWNRPGVSAEQQPLLSIIEQRINNSRKKISLSELDSNSMWSTYFPNTILGKNPQTYILHNSWYRPRDIIRLLKIAQDQFPESKNFSTNVLEPIRKKYSSDSWVEMSEELKAKYSANQIAAIKKIFYGTQQIWPIGELKIHINSLAENSSIVRDLIKNSDVETVLDDVYRVGIVGNINRKTYPYKMRFVFRGDAERISNQDIYIHNALLAYLSI